MKQAFQKYIYWLMGTIILAALVLYGLPEAQNTDFSFQLSGDGQTVQISPYMAEDGVYYVFLPSYAEMEQLIPVISSGHTITLDGTELSAGAGCADFALETDYDLTIDGSQIGRLQFLRSANVAALHIQTATGSMANIYQDKDYEEPISMVLYAQDGTVDYLDTNSKIKGRGNATWNYAKKPYNLILPAASGLLGMGSGTNWVLLANATDESNLHNKLVFDLAEHLGLPGTPECAYVDLYLNGAYRGLYLLSSKVETGSTRLDMDAAAGDFLCKVDLSMRWETLRSPFRTQLGRVVEISEPKHPTSQQYASIEGLVNEMEQTILSGEDLGQRRDFDLRSWVCRYLIDELSANIDADLASSYFYYQDGRFHAGPVWDYDMTFGNSYRNVDPCTFVSGNALKSAGFVSPYYGPLCENESFRKAMTEVWQEEVVPWVQQMLDTGIRQLAGSIETASRLNRLRWGYMYDGLYATNEIMCSTADSVTDYLDQRAAFLNSVWIDGAQYCHVRFEVIPDDPCWTFTVPKGGVLATPYLDMWDTQWVVSQTGEPFDLGQPITEDLLLCRPSAEGGAAAQQEEERIATREIVAAGSILLLLGAFVWLLVADLRRRAKERRNASEYAGTNLSP